MRVLVVHGSKHGGTAGLAAMVRGALRARGFDVAIYPAGWVRRVHGFDVVVVGGALHHGRWHHQTRRFVHRHRHALRACDVWFFSSGPLDASARDGAIPPTSDVARLMRRVGARGHMTFGGCRPPGRVDEGGGAWRPEDDWRDPVHVTEWVGSIADALGVQGWRPQPWAAPVPTPGAPASERVASAGSPAGTGDPGAEPCGDRHDDGSSPAPSSADAGAKASPTG